MKTKELTSALLEVDKFKDKPLALFLDYDGTLAPIVSNPKEAYLSDSMREVLKKIATKFPLAIVSGRDLRQLQNFVKLDLYYIGSHGYELAGPNGFKREMTEAKELIPLLDQFEKQVKKTMEDYVGAICERKRFSLAVHYRNVEERKQNDFRQKVEELGNKYEKMKWSYGKKVLELQPKLDWNKGKAVLWLSDYLKNEHAFKVYIGDDLTDEDAFKVLKEEEIGIVVSEEERETDAKYLLKDTREVERFLTELFNL